MDTRVYTAILAAIATAAVACVLGLLVAPFAKSLIWALIIGVSTSPYYKKIKVKMPNHPFMSAGLMTLIITLCVVLPLAALVVVIVDNAADWLKESEQLVRSLSTTKLTTFLSHFPLFNKINAVMLRVGGDVTGYVGKIATSASQYFLESATNLARNIADLLFSLAMTLFILFFIYRDGERVIVAGVSRFATNQVKAYYYLSEIQSTTTAVSIGTLFTCIVQGVLAGVGYYFAGTPLPVLFAVMTALAGLIPVVGTAVIWMPLAGYIAIGGDVIKGVLLSLWCLIVVVAVTDNVIRPLAIGAKSGKIPALAVILGAVGGVLMMGVLGLILGPIIFSILVIIWRDVTDYEDLKNSEKKSQFL